MKTHYFKEENITTTGQLSDLLDSWVMEGKNTYQNLTEEAKRFLESSPYILKGYDQNNLVLLMDYQNQNDKNLIAFWELLNTYISAVIRNIKTKDLERMVIIRGESFSLAYIVFDYVGHLRHHLEDL